MSFLLAAIKRVCYNEYPSQCIKDHFPQIYSILVIFISADFIGNTLHLLLICVSLIAGEVNILCMTISI